MNVITDLTLSLSWWMKDLAKNFQTLGRRGVGARPTLDEIRGMSTPWDAYVACQKSFYRLPLRLKKVRWFFRKSKRGFGEDAFFSLWFALFKSVQPANCLEIGVYRGQILAAWTAIAEILGINTRVVGVSPLTSAGDSVSEYLEMDYERDIMNSFDHLQLRRPELIRGLSTDDSVLRKLKSEQFDLIYIDGSHEYEVVKHDVLRLGSLLASGGFLILDDAALFMKGELPKTAFRGHAGPSLVAKQMNDLGFSWVVQVGHNVVFQRVE